MRAYFVQVTFSSVPTRSPGTVKVILWAETVPLIWSRSAAEVCRAGAKVTSNDPARDGRPEIVRALFGSPGTCSVAVLPLYVKVPLVSPEEKVPSPTVKVIGPPGASL